jgi:hypothetical protein
MCGVCGIVVRKGKLSKHANLHHNGNEFPLRKGQEPIQPIILNWKEIIDSKKWIEPKLDLNSDTKFLSKKQNKVD